MQTAEFRTQVLAALPGAQEPEGERDDLYPFAFVSAVFAPAYMDALTHVAEGAGAEPAAEAKLQVLSGLMETAFDTGDGEIVDALAMRVVQGRLCQRPSLLAVAMPYLGPVTRDVVGKFQALVSACEQREADAAKAAGAASAASAATAAAQPGVNASPNP